ncbi:MAG: galactokinase family protein [Bacteroidales bacterium]|nr:galactokinase family protein [Bacteroidales bacterium]
MKNSCTKVFKRIYKCAPEGVSFCPQRVVLVGAHSDYGLGKSTGFALDKGIQLAYRKKTNGVVELRSLQFDKRAQWHVLQTPDKQNDWADYLRGATLALIKRYKLKVGLSGVIEGSLPIGGLSSSAAVTISFLAALAKVNEVTLSRREIVDMALEAERDYVGVNVGKNDQACEVYSRKGHMIYVDNKYDSFELIPTSLRMKPYKIAVFFSGLERNLSGTNLNMRVDELRSAAYALKAYAGMEYGKYKETNLRDVPRSIYDDYKHLLPETWRKRAEHWYTEQTRVEMAAEAWRRGDIETYGRLSFESGASSINNWETGCPELKTLYDIMTHTEGIYGGRFSGAGFKGCCVALINPDYEQQITEQVTREYLQVFPELTGKYKCLCCETSDGLKL